jgi:hypothetical protein
VSTAAAGLGPDDLDAIRITSERNNAARGLTGFLLHQGDRFYGLLEGPRRLLLARMEVIVTDRRHGSLRVLREADVATCRFRNWTFGALPALGPAETSERPSVDFIVNLSRRLR